MLSQSDLARRFAGGETSGKASNVQIIEGDGNTMLVGYGHAVYAVRDKETAEVTVYAGWANQQLGADASDGWGRGGGRAHAGSMSTKSQFGTMSLGAYADEVVAYERSQTDTERRMKDGADTVVDDPPKAAPKLVEV